MKYGKFVGKTNLSFNEEESKTVQAILNSAVENGIISGYTLNETEPIGTRYGEPTKTLLRINVKFPKVPKYPFRDFQNKNTYIFDTEKYPYSLNIMIYKQKGYMDDGSEAPEFQYQAYYNAQGKVRKYKCKHFGWTSLKGIISSFEYDTDLYNLCISENIIKMNNFFINSRQKKVKVED